jgi:hypothetical protein
LKEFMDKKILDKLRAIIADCDERLVNGFKPNKPKNFDPTFIDHEEAIAIWEYRKSLFEKYTPKFRDYIKYFVTKEKNKEEIG